MNILLHAIAAAAFAGQPAPAPNGNRLLEACTFLVRGYQKPAEHLEAFWCAGYVTGLLDGLAFTAMRGAGMVCPPKMGIEAQQSARVIIKYLENNPEKLHESARSLAIVALATAFPCAKG